MSFLLKFHHLLSLSPVVSIVGPLVFLLAALAALHYLQITRELREQFAVQQSISVELRKLSTAVEQSPASIVITNRRGFIEYVNPAFCRLTGYSFDEALGKNPKILKGSKEPREYYKTMWDTLLSGREWRGEFLNKRKDGSLFWELASISPIKSSEGEITHFVGVKENITERKLLLEHLDRMAHYDKLTGLPNRALFFDRLALVESQSRRERRRIGLLFLDLDGFKEVNDSHGHEAGDAVLRVTAERLSACIRDCDTAARMGGDEFTVILGNLGKKEDALMVGEKILLAVAEPIELPDGNRCRIGASIGIGIYPQDADNIEMLVSAADAAMYDAKREGKNVCRFYRRDPGARGEEQA